MVRWHLASKSTNKHICLALSVNGTAKGNGKISWTPVHVPPLRRSSITKPCKICQANAAQLATKFVTQCHFEVHVFV